jgi:hypothetical protein
MLLKINHLRLNGSFPSPYSAGYNTTTDWHAMLAFLAIEKESLQLVRANPPPDPIRRFEKQAGSALLVECSGTAKTGQVGANDDHVAIHRHHSSASAFPRTWRSAVSSLG